MKRLLFGVIPGLRNAETVNHSNYNYLSKNGFRSTSLSKKFKVLFHFPQEVSTSLLNAQEVFGTKEVQVDSILIVCLFV